VSRRPGIVLVLALLVLLALGLLGAALVTAAGQQRRIAARHGDLLKARLAAEAALTLAVVDWPPGFELPEGGPVALPWAAGLLPGAGVHRATGERLTDGLLLLRGEGEVGVAARAVAAGLARVPALDSVGGLVAAALEAGGTLHLGTEAVIDATAPDPPPGWPLERCPGGEATAAALRLAVPEGLVREDGAVVLGSIEAGTADRLIAALRPLLRSADHRLGMRGAPAPRVEGDDCLEDPWNWGDPRAPSSPCGDRFPFLHAPQNLEITGGFGQAVLYVEGDLVLRSDTELSGLIVVTGRLEVERGAAIRGTVVAAGEPGHVAGEIRLSRCAAGLALRHSGATRPLPNPGRTAIPAF
jgi:hypothetical protein